MIGMIAIMILCCLMLELQRLLVLIRILSAAMNSELLKCHILTQLSIMLTLQ